MTQIIHPESEIAGIQVRSHRRRQALHDGKVSGDGRSYETGRREARGLTEAPTVQSWKVGNRGASFLTAEQHRPHLYRFRTVAPLLHQLPELGIGGDLGGNHSVLVRCVWIGTSLQDGDCQRRVAVLGGEVKRGVAAVVDSTNVCASIQQGGDDRLMPIRDRVKKWCVLPTTGGVDIRAGIEKEQRRRRVSDFPAHASDMERSPLVVIRCVDRSAGIHQDTNHGGVNAGNGAVKWSVPVFVDGVWLGPGLQQRGYRGGTALLARVMQGRKVVLVRLVGVGTGVQQRRDNRVKPNGASANQRRALRRVLAVDLGTRLDQDQRSKTHTRG